MLRDIILVTGGAGYIGSHCAKELFINSFTPLTFDNFSEGNRHAVKWGPLVEGDIKDLDKLNYTIKKYKPKAVMHFAANALVGESQKNPKKYYENNVLGTINLLDAMLTNNIKHIIFSSSCATYGIPERTPIDEDHPQCPISTYGKTKYMIEDILKDYERAYNLKFASLRYFNAAGADLECEIGEDRRVETHLIPLAIEAAFNLDNTFNIFGKDFKTKDGTAIRDYIHVNDLATAHRKALLYLFEKNKSLTLNLGTGKGYSILEVIKEIEKESGKKLKLNFTKKREGDPSTLFANSRLASKILDWKCNHSDLNTIIKTAIKWHISKTK